MTRKAALLIMLPALVSVACMSSFQSSFFSRFSLKELVERNKTVAGLNCSTDGAGGGGGGGMSAGMGGIGKDQSNFHRVESFSCQLSDAEHFEEPNFLQALKESVVKDLEASRARIVTSANPDATSFYIEYALDEIKGRVEISGTRSLGKYYSLTADLNEKTGVK